MCEHNFQHLQFECDLFKTWEEILHTYCEATGSWSKTCADTMHSALFVKIRPYGNTQRVKHPHDLNLNYMLLQTYIFTSFFYLEQRKTSDDILFSYYAFSCADSVVMQGFTFSTIKKSASVEKQESRSGVQ